MSMHVTSLAYFFWGGGVTVIAQFILNLGTRQKWVLNSPQLMLYPQGKKCSAHWIAFCVGSQPAYTFCDKRKIFCICQDMNLGSSSPQPNHHTDSTIVAACKLAEIHVHRNITWDTAQSECGHTGKQYCTTQVHFLWCSDTGVLYFQCSILYIERERGRLTYLALGHNKNTAFLFIPPLDSDSLSYDNFHYF